MNNPTLVMLAIELENCGAVPDSYSAVRERLNEILPLNIFHIGEKEAITAEILMVACVLNSGVRQLVLSDADQMSFEAIRERVRQYTQQMSAASKLGQTLWKSIAQQGEWGL